MEWIVFFAVMASAITLDLFLGHGKDPTKTALWMSAGYVLLAMAFGGFVFWMFGGEAYMQFLGGYVMELALSVDNLFVISVIMASFGIPLARQRPLLFAGIAGAVVFRGAFVLLGIGIISQFAILLPLMGILLFLIGLKLGMEEQIAEAINWCRRKLGLKESSEVPLAVRVLKKIKLNPFVAALLAVEFTDVIFAIDSVPVVLAITQEPFIALSAIMLAVMGLRSLYFALQGMQEKFHKLPKALGVVLGFIGIKLVLLLWHIHLPLLLTLGITFAIIGVGVWVSLRFPKKEERKPDEADAIEGNAH